MTHSAYPDMLSCRGHFLFCRFIASKCLREIHILNNDRFKLKCIGISNVLLEKGHFNGKPFTVFIVVKWQTWNWLQPKFPLQVPSAIYHTKKKMHFDDVTRSQAYSVKNFIQYYPFTVKCLNVQRIFTESVTHIRNYTLTNGNTFANIKLKHRIHSSICCSAMCTT